MATFRTEHESKKWDAISATVSQPLEHMLAGKATPDDLSKIGAALRKYDDLAAKLFEQGIESAEATADAVIDQLNAERIALGKAPISAKAHDRLFKSTFQKVMAASTEDIIGSITDHFDEQLADVKTDLSEKVADAFARVRSLVQQQQGHNQAPANVPAQQVQAWNLAQPPGHTLAPASGPTAPVAANTPAASATPQPPVQPTAPPASTNNPVLNMLSLLGINPQTGTTTAGGATGQPGGAGPAGGVPQSRTMIDRIKSLFGGGDQEPVVPTASYKNVNELYGSQRCS